MRTNTDYTSTRTACNIFFFSYLREKSLLREISQRRQVDSVICGDRDYKLSGIWRVPTNGRSANWYASNADRAADLKSVS